MRHSEQTTIFEIPFPSKLHHTRSADHFEPADFCKLRQDVVLNTVGKGYVLLVVTKILKWQNCDTCCRRLGLLSRKHDR